MHLDPIIVSLLGFTIVIIIHMSFSVQINWGEKLKGSWSIYVILLIAIFSL